MLSNAFFFLSLFILLVENTMFLRKTTKEKKKIKEEILIPRREPALWTKSGTSPGPNGIKDNVLFGGKVGAIWKYA